MTVFRILLMRTFYLVFLLGIGTKLAHGQTGDDGKLVVKKKVGTVISPKLEKLRSRLDYMDSKQSYIFKICLLDSSIVQANSDIFYDQPSQKYYILYLKNDTIQKIYPEQTLLVSKKVNTEDESRRYVGVPTESCWRFCIIKGHMNGITFYLRSNPGVNEIQVDDSDFISITSSQAENYFKTSPKAYKYYLAKDYSKAIKVWNSSN